MNCSICGSPIEEGKKVCPVCGCPVNIDAGSEPMANQSVEYSQSRQTGNFHNQNSYYQGESSFQNQSSGYGSSFQSSSFSGFQQEVKTGMRVWGGVICAANYLLAINFLASLQRYGAMMNFFGMEQLTTAFWIGIISCIVVGTGYLMLTLQKGQWKTLMYVILAGLVAGLIADLMVIGIPGVDVATTITQHAISFGVAAYFWYMFSTGKAYK